MLRLRKCILSRLLSPPSPSTPSITAVDPISPLRRLLCATATPFAPVDYLVANCGLTRAKALKASKKLAHLESPSKPDAVLAFLAGLGLSRGEVATVISSDPLFLCADVEKALAPRVVKLRELGLSRSEIARLVLVSRSHFRSGHPHRNVGFFLQIFGSLELLLRTLKMNGCLLSVNIEKIVKPNLALLQQRGINASDLPDYMSRVLVRSTKHLQEALARVDEVGVEQNSWAFPHAVSTFAILSHEKLNVHLQLLEKLGWSRDDISVAISRGPNIMRLSEEKIRRNLEFLMGDVGLEIPYIAQKPTLMLYSLERRLLPRYCLLNILKARGLLNAEYSFYSIATLGKVTFLDRFVHPYEESVPGLTAAYASSCAGKPQWDLLNETAEEKRKS